MKNSKVCSACNKKRVYMFEVGIEGSRLLGCLYCVKTCDARLVCDTCGVEMGLSDGHSSIAFCASCHLGKKNVACHKCGDDLAYAPDGFKCVKVFCVECMRKVRDVKKKKNKD